MNLIEAKITAIITLGLGSLFMGLLPVIFTRYSRNKYPLFLSSLLCFGSGVLLSTSMVHMLPEVRQSLVDHSKYAELLFCVGFFILYCIDEMVHLCKHTHNSNEHHQRECQSLIQNTRRHSTGCNYNYGTLKTEREYLKQPSYNPEYYKNNTESNSFIHELPSTSSCSYEHIKTEHNPSQLCHIGHQEPCRTTNTSSISLIIALTVHAVLEGLAVGLEDSTSQVLLMLGAIASHKLVVAFCVGMELSSSRQTTTYQYFISVIMFSFGSVLGIALGLSVTDLFKKLPDLLISVLQALAGGTLLYITVSEVLPRERAQWHQTHTRKAAGIIQFISVIIGFIIMSTLIKCLHE